MRRGNMAAAGDRVALGVLLLVHGCARSLTASGSMSDAATTDGPPAPEARAEAPTLIAPTVCGSNANCPEGLVCGPDHREEQGCDFNCLGTWNTCAQPCQLIGCRPDEACQSTGACAFVPCDQAGAAPCPEHWTCSPAAAQSEPFRAEGSAVRERQKVSWSLERGCVRKRCDEPDGFTCRELWRCDPASATDASGCMPVPCAETGHCSSDILYLCVPTSVRSRPPQVDGHGCVSRNCEEGLPCEGFIDGVNIGYCDFDGPYAIGTGCALRPCTEVGGLCGDPRICDPASAHADLRGCRDKNCKEQGGFGCPIGWRCDPASAPDDPAGCMAATPDAGGN